MTTPLFESTQPRASLSRFVPGRYQPRKRFNEAALAEMAGTIKKHGVMSPILVRPVPGEDLGSATFRMEIVAGERRWRASQLAGVPDIPFVLKDLSTLDVLELQVIENVQREDLHPLEEAEGYDLLMHPPEGEAGLTVPQIADAVKKSPEHIRETVKLCALIPDARTAYLAEPPQLTKATALRIAMMPPSIQPRALAKVLSAQANNGGKLLTANAVSELLQAQFMLKLANAPFNTADETLVPDVGTCKACTKRTGANPDLFFDVPSADTCTDPDCYQTKVAANNACRVSGAREMGQEVLEGDQALAVLKLGPSSDQLGGDYIYLDKPAPELTTETGTLAKALKGFMAPVLILHPEANTLRPIATVDTVKRELKARGLLIEPKAKVGGAMDPATTKTKSDKASKAAAKEQAARGNTQRRTVEIERAVRVAVWRAINRTSPDPGLTRTVRERIALSLASVVSKGHELDLLCDAFMWSRSTFTGDPLPELRRLIAGMDDGDLGAIITLLLPINDDEMTVPDNWVPTAQPETLLAIATSPEFAADIDLPAIRQAEADAWDHDNKPEAATKPTKARKGSAAKTSSSPTDPTISPPPASDRQPGAKAKPKGSAKTKASKDKSQGAQAAPAPQEGPGVLAHWVGQKVKIKGSKKVGEVSEINADGTLLIATDSPSEPGARNLTEHARHEVIVLPGQVRPQAAPEKQEAAFEIGQRVRVVGKEGVFKIQSIDPHSGELNVGAIDAAWPFPTRVHPDDIELVDEEPAT